MLKKYPKSSAPKERKVSQKPLSLQLVFIIVSVLSLALLLASLTTISLLRNSLINRIDQDLVTSGPDLAKRVLEEASNQNVDASPTFLPSDFFLVYQDINGQTITFRDHRQERSFGRPKLPKLSVEQIKNISYPSTQQTVSGTKNDTQWRTITLAVYSGMNKEIVGAATVALPITHVQNTTRSTAEMTIIASLIIIAFAAVISWYSVRRSLRPLRQMESTARLISEGDLSQRAPELPLNTEVGTLSHSFNTMLTQIEEAFRLQESSDARMRQFVSDASHELRTPLATVRGYAELYRIGGVPDEKVGEAMERIESEAKRMGLLVEDLLQLARLDEGRPLHLGTVNLLDIIKDAITDFQVRAPQRSLQLIQLADDKAIDIANLSILPAVMLRADPNSLQQIFANLLNNILQYTPANTPVELAIGQEAEYIILEVRDHGPGVTDDSKQKLFERFYRADKSRSRSSGGSGLGLSIVKKLMNAHHGYVKAINTPGGGLTMRLAFPSLDNQNSTISDKNAN